MHEKRPTRLTLAVVVIAWLEFFGVNYLLWLRLAPALAAAADTFSGEVLLVLCLVFIPLLTVLFFTLIDSTLCKLRGDS